MRTAHTRRSLCLPKRATCETGFGHAAAAAVPALHAKAGPAKQATFNRMHERAKEMGAAVQPMAEAADPTQSLVLVPAFTGLGAPYWNAECRGAVFGLTRNSGPEEFARAALESVGYQTRDLLEAMHADWSGAEEAALRVDGGMSASDFAMQFLADITGAPVDRPRVLETTAMGAAWLAGQRAGIYPDMEGFGDLWELERKFDPAMDDTKREEKYAAWKRAVEAAQAY